MLIAIVVPPTIPTLQVKGYFPLEIINGTKRSDLEVYVFIKAAQEKASELELDKDCVLSLDSATEPSSGLPKMSVQLITTAGDVSQYNYAFSKLPKTSDGRCILLVPPTISGRVYFSVGNPMIMQAKKDANKTLRIGDPDGFKPRDPNYYTLYDKVEYTFTNDGTWLNPTAVDFVSLPIHVEQPDATSPIKSAGFAGSRTAIFESIKGTLTAGAVSPEWSKLVLPFRGTDLRIMAPGKAMVKDMPGANPFNTRYLNAGIPPFNTYDPDAGISASESYTDYLWEYYKKHTLAVNAIELKGKFKIRQNPAEETNEDFQFFGSVNSDNEFVFTNNTATHAETWAELILKFEIPFLVGAQESDDAPKNTLIEVIMRELSSAFAFSYIDFLWNYYKADISGKTKKLGINTIKDLGAIAIGDKSPGNYLFWGSVIGNDFVFTNEANSYKENGKDDGVIIAKPSTSIPFFAGAQESFNAANNTPRAIIVRELTSAFEVGLLPAHPDTILNKDYFIKAKTYPGFYKTNEYLPEKAKAGRGPWYDLYSKALHEAAGESPVYTFAYDDALAQDGTLTDSSGLKPHLAQITIGDLTGVTIPNPKIDTNQYGIKYIVPSGL